MSKNQHEQKLKRADIVFDSITNHIIDNSELLSGFLTSIHNKLNRGVANE